MKFTVVAQQSAEAELADIYLRASDPATVTAAANEIERLLKHDAHTCGRPLNGERYLLVPPLVAIFLVSEPDRMVTIVKFIQAKV